MQILSLYGTFLGANYVSNALLHPNQKLDYGLLNQFYLDDREVNSQYWSTRLPHLLLVPLSLTFWDLVSAPIFARYFGFISFALTPASWLLRLYSFTWLAVGSFFVYDSALNPDFEGQRMDHFTSLLKPLSIGMGLQWHAQIMTDLLKGAVAGPMGYCRNIFATALVFFPVKSLAFGDIGSGGLSPHEMKMNGLTIDCKDH